jgi:uncharacterized protein (TIGR03435 family)
MKRFFPGTMIMTFVCRLALGQVAEVSDKFEIADVHVSPKSTSGGGPMGMNNQFARTGPVRGGRYEVKTASMVDLIRIAYGYATDKILGGPIGWSWTVRCDCEGIC